MRRVTTKHPQSRAVVTGLFANLRGVFQRSTWLKLFVGVVIMIVALGVQPPQAAQSQANLAMNIVWITPPDPNTAVLQTGDIVEYQIRFSCLSLTQPCGNLNITQALPGTDFVEDLTITTAPGYNGNFTATLAATTINIDTPSFQDGSNSQATIRFRIKNKPATPPDFVNGQITGTVPLGPSTATIPPQVLNVQTPTFAWEFTKTRTGPLPVLDEPVEYTLRYCPLNARDNVPLTTITVTDAILNGAVVTNLDSGTYIPGPPASVVWNVADWSPSDGCYERRLDLLFPSGTFTSGTNISNTATGTSTYVIEGTPGVGPIGSSTTPPEPLGTVTGSITAQKTGSAPGAIIAIDGRNRYEINGAIGGATTGRTSQYVLTDTIANQLAITYITSGTWSNSYPSNYEVNGSTVQGGVRAIVQYSTDDPPSTWTTLGTTSGGATWVVGTNFPSNVTAVRWTFEYDNPYDATPATFSPGVPRNFVFGTRPNLVAIPVQGTPLAPKELAVQGQTYDNCLTVDYTFGATPGSSTTSPCVPVTIQANTANLIADKDGINTFKLNSITNLWESSSGAGNVVPEDIVMFEYSVRYLESSGAPLVAPAVVDTLPTGFTYVAWNDPSIASLTSSINQYEFAGTIAGENTPPTFTQAGQVLRWNYSQTFVPPAAINSTEKRLTIRYLARVQRNLPVLTYNNVANVLSTSEMRCGPAANLPLADTADLDSNGSTIQRCEVDYGTVVRAAVKLNSQKWIRSLNLPTFRNVSPSPEFPDDASCPVLTDGGTFTRFPCVAFGEPANPDNSNDQFENLIVITNDGNITGNNYALYDILPFVGDTGVSGPLQSTGRATQFLAQLRGAIQDLDSVSAIIEYNLTSNPCRSEVFLTTDPQSPGCNNTWTNIFTPDARSFRIRVNSIPIGVTVRFRVPMTIPAAVYTDPPTNSIVDAANTAQSREISWNSFAQVISDNNGIRQPPAEPRKVGIIVPDILSIGNRVWFDGNDNGRIDNTDDFDPTSNGLQPGIAGVTVRLYGDTNNNTIFDAGDTQIGVDRITDANGYYLFDNIPVTNPLAPGSGYFVQILPANFGAGQPLEFLRSTTNSEASDTLDTTVGAGNADNGVDDASYLANGIVSNQIVLTTPPAAPPAGGEPTGESDLPPGTAANFTAFGPLLRGRHGEADWNSNLTVDFGFTTSRMSLGNRLWFDDGTAGPGSAGYNDGIRNNGEVGVPNGVVVQLLFDADDNGVIDGAETTPVQSTTTYADPLNAADLGYYMFTGLQQGNYAVRVAASNFALPTAGTPDGGPLVDYLNSTSPANPNDATIEDNDSGINPATPAAYQTGGVSSGLVRLTRETEPTGESDSSPTPVTGVRPFYGAGVADNNSDTTVDFGFYRPPMSLGNRVWVDSNNNGVLDATDDSDPVTAGIQGPGLAGLTVQLIEDRNLNGTYEPATDIIRGTTTTDTNGRYRFDDQNATTTAVLGVRQRTYLVRLTPENFGAAAPAVNLISSTGVDPTTTRDSTGTQFSDNGVDRTSYALQADTASGTGGIFSNPVPMRFQTMPAAETDLAASDPGLNVADPDSNLTIDFGLFEPLSIGNRVWLDSGATATGTNLTQYNDGILNGTEAGVAGVRVELYRDVNGTGGIEVGNTASPDFLGFTVTDANGFYIFDQLIATDYRVFIPTSNFTGGGTLRNANFGAFLSSTGGEAGQIVDHTNTTTFNDNGVDSATPATTGIQSNLITLTYRTQPTDDSEDVFTPTPPSTPSVPLGRGPFTQLDENSNLTVDFGFITRPMSLGNRVWLDNGTGGGTANDGILNGGELGVEFVTVSLYFDNDNGGLGDGVPDGAAIRTDVTDANGYYLFDNLPPGRYIVGVDAVNFTATQPLDEYTSSVPTVSNAANNLDSRDNGINIVTPASSTFGVITSSINLTTLVGIPTGETGSGNTTTTVGNNPTAGDGPNSRGRYGETDASSDLTIDFGFFKPMSIGNRVWLDNGAGGGTINDGLQNGTEAGIANVRVELYNADASGVPTGALLAFDTTDATGYYLFDQLPPGNYVVVIPASNFAVAAPLAGLSSSIPTGTEDTAVTGSTATPATDRDDNGIDDYNPFTNGIRSGLIVLATDTEPTGETDLSGQADPGAATNATFSPTGWDGPNSRGRWNESDDNSNLTVDFGFIPPLSIGNRVWLDSGVTATATATNQFNDGLQNGIEPGISGVAVTLFRDNNGDNDFIDAGEAIRITTTDANGYYLFDRLPPGNYAVRVDAANFGAGQPLVNLLTSTGANADNTIDVNDNGVDSPTYLTDGIYGNPLTLAYGNQPLTPANETDIPANNGTNTAAYGTNLRGRFGEADADSNLTMDFGFIAPPVSLGNRVWSDNGAGGGTANDGILNGGELGIAGVRVSLYEDFNNDNQPDDLGVIGNRADDFVRYDITDATGYYLFDNLPLARYIVGVDAINFTAAQPLDEYTSSVPTVDNAANNLDSRDNGINIVTPATSTFGVITSSINLTTLAGIPTGETGSGDVVATLGNNPTAGDGPNSRGRYGETDASSDLTIDFGFFKPMSIGNRVWLDNGVGGGTINDGLQNGGELGIANVRVELFNADGTGAPTGPLLAFDTTDATGYYLFDQLPPGNYVVIIPASNFATAAPLAGLNSSIPTGTEDTAVTGSTATPATDRDDNGIDDYNPFTNGIRSGLIVLATDTEPTGETDLSGDTATTAGFSPTGGDGPNSRGRWNESDDNSNLTVDFGFIPPLSIGNRVWRDNGATATGTNLDQFNDGLQNGTEPGAANVALTLFRDNNGDNDFLDAGEAIRITTTDVNGYYLFDRLPPGNYAVRVDAANFATAQPLVNTLSSTGASAVNTTDVNDNGVDSPTYLTDGIFGNALTLGYGSQPSTPTDETDIPANNAGNIAAYGTDLRGLYGEADADSNLTMDFGFSAPRSIGNRVWLDNGNGNPAFGNDGIQNNGEVGIANVRVSLYLDENSDNAPDGAAIRYDTTDANGYYLFDRLAATSYIVGVDAVNFTTGQPLFNFGSSIPTVNNATNNTDQRDNGINSNDPANATYGIITATINLAATPPSVPTGEADLSGDTATTAGFSPTGGDGPGSLGRFFETDLTSDLTIDFGFFRPYSIGNRVWRDNGAGAGGVRWDGIQNGTEAGIAGVRVELYRDDGDGVFERTTGDTFVVFDTTDASGYYLFDGLIDATYYVWVSNVNFGSGQPLELFDTSPGNGGGDNQTDLNDNGIDENFPATFGVVSNAIVLSEDDEQTGEVVSGAVADGPNGRGNNNEADLNSDLTVDFGFDTQPFSLGNRVWFDLNNNGVMDASETGSPNVRVFLYEDNGDNTYGAGDTLIAQDITDANGFYLFESRNLVTGTPPLFAGNYFVAVDQLEFRIGGDLVDYYSSTLEAPDNQTDIDDNGVNNYSGVLPINPQVGGIVSPLIQLRKNTEPIGTGTTPAEVQLSGEATDGPNGRGNFNQLDSNSDLTVDFGFYKPMSIGNRVWFDIDNSGTINGTETGILGVVVNLYRDDDNNGTPDGAAIATDTTNTNGYYLFDNLTPGGYVVQVDPVNFSSGVLVGVSSSTGNTPTAGVDRNDNGIDNVTPATNGIFSNTVRLTLDGQPINEPDISGDVTDGPNSIGNNGETDRNSDLTIDFGFFTGSMSLGNRVWLDPNNNGLIDGTEIGIANVAVSLYRDTNNDNTPDGPAIRTDTTDANGYYLFEGLTPGNYIVGLNTLNFNAGNPLNGLISSTGNAGDTQVDLDDNGRDVRNALYGLLSPTIVLQTNAENAAETDLGPEGNGTGVTANNSELTVDFGLFQPMSLGNRVWFDTNDDGLQNNLETGIGGVTVGLYRADSSGTIIGAALETQNTDANGYYMFDGLGAGTYVVRVEASNFAGVLVGLVNSTPTFSDNADSNDNGINATNTSNAIVLTLNTQPQGETDLGPDGRGTNGETDANSNLTIDFGYTGANMSLGNRVWNDNGVGAGGFADDGIQNGTEPGLANVRVSLYRDVNNDGLPDGAAFTFTTTDANGYYLFSNLSPGRYIVGLDAGNFTGVLSGFGSSTPNFNDNVDRNDNGINNNNPQLNGILSNSINLVRNTTPTGEADLAPVNPLGGATDNNSDLTIDFGLYKAHSIGNRVWFDPDNSGTINGAEVGIAGVSVSLFRDNGDGVFDSATDAVVGSPDITDSRGYYLFSNLPTGNYFVRVDPSNFTSGALVGFNSSTDPSSPNGDNNDNGVGITPGANGIVSNLITVADDTMPTGETDTSGNNTPITGDGPYFRGQRGESDNNSDLTVDFGFTAGSMSIGNRVWLDNGAGGGIANNGLRDSTELGVGNVTVSLYTDTDSNGQPDGAPLRSITTNVNGYYLFDALPPGNYLVRIEPTNFAPGGALFGVVSSSGNNQTTDNNDHGIDNAAPATNGVFSGTIVLVPNTAPTGETDFGPEVNGIGVTDPNANLTIDFGFVARNDLGDAPDSYGTTIAANGPRHTIISTLYLGSVVDDENDGQPNAGANGDDTTPASPSPDDEDGVFIPTLVAGTTVNLEVTVFNNTGTPATFVGWIDFNGSGTFDAGEGVTATIPSSATTQIVQVPISVPIDADVTTGGSTYARFRLSTDALTTATPTGAASNGEVEDYRVTGILPPGVAITKTDGQSSIVVGQSTTYTITITNSGVDVINRQFIDTPPTGDPNGFDPATLTWTCAATGGASCISGQPSGTPANGLGPIDALIDVPRGSTVIYTYSMRLRSTYNLPTVTNESEVVPGVIARDVNGVIFDPPRGTKVGVVLNGTVIRWTMLWLNTGGQQTATVSDTLQANQTFIGNLTCPAFGTSTTTTCVYTAATNTITWTGSIGTGDPNRVEITYDVSVPGDGEYNNVGTIDVGGNRAAAAGTVRIGSATGSASASPLIFTKSAEPNIVKPGDEVRWTIVVANPNSSTSEPVVVTDTLPAGVNLISVNATQGTVAVSGSTITATVGNIAPGGNVIITIRSKLSTTIGGEIENEAILNGRLRAKAKISVVGKLPPTGITPEAKPTENNSWGLPLLLGGLGSLLLAGYVIQRRRRSSMTR